MESLPKGWLFADSDIYLKLCGSMERLWFDGRVYGDLSKAQGKDRDEFRVPNKRIRYNDKDGCVAVIEATEDLGKEFQVLEQAENLLSQEIAKARMEAQTAVHSVNTTKQLEEAWPELAPFMPQSVKQHPVPAKLDRKLLNKMFALPKEDA